MAGKSITALARIMTNVRVSSSKKRTVLVDVVHSTVWHSVLSREGYKRMLDRAQRLALLRLTKA